MRVPAACDWGKIVVDLLLRVFALGVGACFAYEVWRMFGDRAETEPGWVASLMGETLDQEATPVRFWVFVVCETLIAAVFIVAAFLPPAQMRALLNSVVI